MRTIAALFTLVSAPLALADTTFIFTFTPQSTLTLAPDFTILTEGSLIGDFNAESNPSGTQTRPGLFGGSGNNPIPATIDFALAGSDSTRPSGHFRFDVDLQNRTFSLASLSIDLLGGASLDTPLTVGLLYSTFRSIAPSSLYIGGVRLPVPLGNATISALSIAQASEAPGLLVPTADERVFTFATLLPVTLTVTASALTQTFDLPEVPAALPLTGTLDTRTTPPTITISWDTSVEQEVPADVIAQIPPIENQPLDLPTILPPGQTARLLLNLAVTSASTSLTTTATLIAAGVPRCDADLNADGVIDFFDYADFIEAFESGSPLADFNQDNFLDFFDYADFVQAFESGC